MNYIGGKAAKGSGRVNADRQVLKEETFKCTDPNHAANTAERMELNNYRLAPVGSCSRRY